MIRLVPNILTLARLVGTVIFLGMILYAPKIADDARWKFLDAAFVLFIIASLTDIIDGQIARKYNVTSKFGRMIDPLADKILVCGSFICFAIIAEPKLFGLAKASLAAIHWTVAGILVPTGGYDQTGGSSVPEGNPDIKEM